MLHIQQQTILLRLVVYKRCTWTKNTTLAVDKTLTKLNVIQQQATPKIYLKVTSTLAKFKQPRKEETKPSGGIQVGRKKPAKQMNSNPTARTPPQQSTR